MKIPFFDATRQYEFLKNDIRLSIDTILSSGRYVLGPQGAAFEEAFAKMVGVDHGIGVNSGTDAIKIALRACGVGEGDEVITVSLTAVPTVSAIRELGATPIFIDVDDFFTIDVNKIESCINKKTKAIVAVHLYGQPCDMPSIQKIAKRYHLKVIEDCAQAVGSCLDGKMLGSFGDISCFSFYPTKNLGAYGDGGMILTGSYSLAQAAKSLRFYGMEKQYYAEREGFNSRLDEIQAGILLVKMKHLDAWNVRRRAIASFYTRHIQSEQIKLPLVRETAIHTFHLYVVEIPERERFIEYLASHGIGTGIHYPTPVHLQRAYTFLDYKKGSLPRTEMAAKQVVSLPIFPELTAGEISYIIEKVNAFS